MNNLLFAVLCLIERVSLICVFHSVAQLAVEERFGTSGLRDALSHRPQQQNAAMLPH
jgi:hypothetical protein